jgi:hypothetical protein
MPQKALAEQPSDDLHVSGAYALAIEPDREQARILEQMLEGRIGGTLRVARSTDEAFASLASAVPDVILMSPLLAPQDEEQIVARLAALGEQGAHVKLLSIPRVMDDSPAEKKRRFGWQSPKSTSTTNTGCDPVAFATEVAEYLTQASTLRQPPPAGDAAQSRDDTLAGDTLAGLRLEHIEQLLDRLDADAVDADASSDAPAVADAPPDPVVDSTPISERELMAISTAHDSGVDITRGSTDGRLPRFLNLDERVPVPLRALLDEADGCLKMGFMTGAGACAGRTLDLLVSEQGLAGVDRNEQIQQLGKKQPAVAESFLRGLTLVMNNPSGAWDEARVTLAVVILKAIAYEIYVLGPERKERASYVIELLERFKTAGRG